MFVAAEIFFERFEFLVCSTFNHTQCGRTCACAVACLCPHNSISNVVVSVTIHDKVHIYQRCSKNMKPETLLAEHQGKCLSCKSFVIFVFCVCVCVSVSLCLCLCLCVSVSLCFVVVVEGGRGRRRETTRTIWLLIPARASLKIAETEQLYLVKRMIGGIGDMLFSI